MKLDACPIAALQAVPGLAVEGRERIQSLNAPHLLGEPD